MRTVETIEKKVIRPIRMGFLMLAGLIVLVLMVSVIIDVLGRYVLHTTLIQGIYSIDESYLLPTIIMLGLAASYEAGIFPRVDFLEARWPPKRRKVVALICVGCELFICATMAVYAFSYTIWAFGEKLKVGVGKDLYPVYPFILVMFLCLVMLTLEIALKFAKTAAAQPKTEKQETTTATPSIV